MMTHPCRHMMQMASGTMHNKRSKLNRNVVMHAPMRPESVVTLDRSEMLAMKEAMALRLPRMSQAKIHLCLALAMFQALHGILRWVLKNSVWFKLLAKSRSVPLSSPLSPGEEVAENSGVSMTACYLSFRGTPFSKRGV